MNALITGGTKGIGLAITKELLGLGYDCVVTSRNISKEISELIEKGSTIKYLSIDISQKNDREELSLFLENLDSLDIAINCAGVAPKLRKDMLEIDEEDFDYVMDINLKGTYFISQIIAKKMLKQSYGRIINISSLSSYTSSTKRAEYCISKAGISMITKLLTDRLSGNNIKVFEISPGIISTDMTSVVKDSYINLIENGLTPIKRIGEATDVASCVTAIAKGYLDFCAGTVLNCDGGFSIRRL